MKKVNYGKRVLVKEPHLRWNCDLDNPHNPEMVLYMMSISGPKNLIRKTWTDVLKGFAPWTGAVDILREEEGKVGGTENFYKLYVFESRARPSILTNELSLDVPKVRDPKFYERTKKSYEKDGSRIGFSLENYVAQLFK